MINPAISNKLERVIEWAQRSRRAYWIIYTALFSIAAFVCLMPFLIEGKHLMWKVDGLEIAYPKFVYFGWWVREAVKLTVESGSLVLPQWDLSFGLGESQLAVNGFMFANPFNYIWEGIISA